MQEIYKQVCEKSPDAIIGADEKGSIIFWNNAAEKMFGYAGNEILGRPLTVLMPEKYREGHLAGVKRFLETGKPTVVGKVSEVEGLHKDGKVFPIQLSVSAVKNSIWIFAGIVRDITEQKSAEEIIKKHAKELEEANHLKDLFIDIIRHDLLNPASVIKMFAESLAEEVDEKQKEEALRIKHNAEIIIEMIETASNYAKLESIENLEMSTVELNEIFKNAIDELKPLAEEKKMKIEYLTRNTCHAKANPIIENVFLNLLSNAIKYSPDGKKIEINILDEGTNYRIYVKDWGGHGITDKDKAELFTRFKRVDKKGVKGTGLGLAIVRRIVALHRGKVWIEDNPEGGSVFYVEIPKG